MFQKLEGQAEKELLDFFLVFLCFFVGVFFLWRRPVGRGGGVPLCFILEVQIQKKFGSGEEADILTGMGKTVRSIW